MNQFSLLALSHEFPPLGGGAAAVLSKLCIHLNLQGIDIEVWTESPKQKFSFPFKVRYFRTHRRKRFETNVTAMLLWCLKVIISGLFVRKNRFDYILSNMAIPAALAGSVLSVVKGIVHIVWYHGADIHANSPNGPGIVQKILLKLIGTTVAVHCFPSDGLRLLAQRCGIKGSCILLPVMPCSVENSAANQSQIQTDKKRIFLFTGRLEAVKNPLLLVEAIRLLYNDECLIQMHFKFVGSGALQKRLNRRIVELGIQNYVSLHPQIPQQQMAEVFRCSYALVIPSRVESFPITVLEAALMELPSIGSNTLGLNEAIIHNKTGLLFEENNPFELASTIRILANDIGLRDRLGKNARTWAQNFSVERTSQCFLKALEKAGRLKQNNRV